MKSNLRRKTEIQFSTPLEMFQNNKGKMVVVLNTVSKEKLFIEVVKLQETLKNLTEIDLHKQIDYVAESFVMKSDHRNMYWPSLTSQLSSENISLPSQLHFFLSILLHDDEDRLLTTKVSSFP